MNSDYPKQYLKIDNICIIEHTLQRLLSHPKISRIVVVLAKEDPIFSQLNIAKNPAISTVVGGKERCDSVLAGLKALNFEGLEPSDSWVLVHDAARPCISHQDIDNLIDFCCNKQSGAILATPVRDTMKRSNNQLQILRTENRENLWHAQTPQMFKHDELQLALETALLNNLVITDEASAIEAMGLASFIVSGREDNIKITRPSDLNLAKFILSQQEYNVCG